MLEGKQNTVEFLDRVWSGFFLVNSIMIFDIMWWRPLLEENVRCAFIAKVGVELLL